MRSFQPLNKKLLQELNALESSLKSSSDLGNIPKTLDNISRLLNQIKTLDAQFAFVIIKKAIEQFTRLSFVMRRAYIRELSDYKAVHDQLCKILESMLPKCPAEINLRESKSGDLLLSAAITPSGYEKKFIELLLYYGCAISEEENYSDFINEVDFNDKKKNCPSFIKAVNFGYFELVELFLKIRNISEFKSNTLYIAVILAIKKSEFAPRTAQLNSIRRYNYLECINQIIKYHNYLSELVLIQLLILQRDIEYIFIRIDNQSELYQSYWNQSDHDILVSIVQQARLMLQKEWKISTNTEDKLLQLSYEEKQKSQQDQKYYPSMLKQLGLNELLSGFNNLEKIFLFLYASQLKNKDLRFRYVNFLVSDLNLNINTQKWLSISENKEFYETLITIFKYRNIEIDLSFFQKLIKFLTEIEPEYLTELLFFLEYLPEISAFFDRRLVNYLIQISPQDKFNKLCKLNKLRFSHHFKNYPSLLWSSLQLPAEQLETFYKMSSEHSDLLRCLNLYIDGFIQTLPLLLNAFQTNEEQFKKISDLLRPSPVKNSVTNQLTKLFHTHSVNDAFALLMFFNSWNGSKKAEAFFKNRLPEYLADLSPTHQFEELYFLSDLDNPFLFDQYLPILLKALQLEDQQQWLKLYQQHSVIIKKIKPFVLRSPQWLPWIIKIFQEVPQQAPFIFFLLDMINHPHIRKRRSILIPQLLDRALLLNENKENKHEKKLIDADMQIFEAFYKPFAIEIYDSGDAISSERWLMKCITTQKHIHLFPDKSPTSICNTTEEAIKRIKIKCIDAKEAHNHLAEWTFDYFLGRTAIFKHQENPTKKLAIKFQKCHKSDKEALEREYQVGVYLNEAKTLKSQLPQPKYLITNAETLIQNEWLTKNRDLTVRMQTLIGENPQAIVAFCYEAPTSYFTYLHDLNIPQTEFKTISRMILEDWIKLLFQSGLVCTQPADMFHNIDTLTGNPEETKLHSYQHRSDRGLYRVLVYLMNNHNGDSTGRLTGWIKAIEYLNARASGIADLDFKSVNDNYRPESSISYECFRDVHELHQAKAGHYITANHIASYLFTLFLVIGKRNRELDSQCTTPEEKQKLWMEGSIHLIDLCALTISTSTNCSEQRAKDAIVRLVDEKQLARQMQFFMTNEYISWINKEEIPKDIYGSLATVYVKKERFRPDSFSLQHGFSINQQDPDIGPVNGPFLIQKAIQLFYVTTMIIFHLNSKPHIQRAEKFRSAIYQVIKQNKKARAEQQHENKQSSAITSPTTLGSSS